MCCRNKLHHYLLPQSLLVSNHTFFQGLTSSNSGHPLRDSQTETHYTLKDTSNGQHHTCARTKPKPKQKLKLNTIPFLPKSPLSSSFRYSSFFNPKTQPVTTKMEPDYYKYHYSVWINALNSPTWSSTPRYQLPINQLHQISFLHPFYKLIKYDKPLCKLLSISKTTLTELSWTNWKWKVL